jgi:tetratricopeptide (TPR) repeat protein
VLGQYNQAISKFKASVHLWPEHIASHLWLAAAYSLSGRMAEARTEIAEVHRINPSYSFEQFERNCYYDCKKDDKERIIKALREAGLG